MARGAWLDLDRFGQSPEKPVRGHMGVMAAGAATAVGSGYWSYVIQRSWCVKTLGHVSCARRRISPWTLNSSAVSYTRRLFDVRLEVTRVIDVRVPQPVAWALLRDVARLTACIPKLSDLQVVDPD